MRHHHRSSDSNQHASHSEGNQRPTLWSFSALLVTLCAVALFKWLDDSRARWLWAFSILAILATATQLFALLAPASMIICVLGVRPRLLAQHVHALLAPIALLAVAAAPGLPQASDEVGQVNWISQGSAGSRLTAELRGPVLGQAYDLVMFVVLVVVVAKLAAVWNRDVRHAVAEQIGRDRDVFALAIGWAVLPTVALSVASFAHPVYDNRYVTASAPGAALLVAFVCVRVFPWRWIQPALPDGTGRRRRRGWILAFIGVAAVVVLATSYVSSASALQEDLQGLGAFRDPARAERGCHCPARSCHYRSSWLLHWRATVNTFPFGHSLAFGSAMSKEWISPPIRLRSVPSPAVCGW